MKILHVDSSITGDTSVSRRLSKAVVERFVASAPAAEVTYRDLARTPLPYFDAESLAGIGVTPAPQLAEHAAEEQIERQVLAEFMAADVIVVGVPMYNFGIPAQLKTWIDYLAVAGITFRYTPQGPEGLAGRRRVVLASSRGGIYAEGTPYAALEHQEAYLKAVFGFFGITNCEVIRAEGVRLSADAAADAIASAETAVQALAA
jgi:FMN-dependent NADH-azoreductase